MLSILKFIKSIHLHRWVDIACLYWTFETRKIASECKVCGAKKERREFASYYLNQSFSMETDSIESGEFRDILNTKEVIGRDGVIKKYFPWRKNQ